VSPGGAVWKLPDSFLKYADITVTDLARMSASSQASAWWYPLSIWVPARSNGKAGPDTTHSTKSQVEG
jgi:hypothetical protein